jgi:MFS family permease
MDEWRRGWRIVLGAALGGGTGASLLFFVFSLFIIPMSTELGGSRGDMANMQALVGVGALASPVVGWATDRWGFRLVYAVCSLMTVATHLWIATWVSSLALFAVAAALFGMFGIGTGPLTYTRPLNAWFDRQRGMALGLGASGLAVSTMIVPPLLALVVEDFGWRAGYIALAGLAGLIGLPAVLLLVRNEPENTALRVAVKGHNDPHQDRSFFRQPVFWILVASLICMAIPGAGFLSQMSPLLQEEGFSATTAALGISAYAAGQVSGRLVAGFALDRVAPQIVGLLFNAVPALGFVLLWLYQDVLGFALGAAALIGIQQGAEIDLFAYIVSRRFGMPRYGTIYGWLLGLGWVGNAVGVLSFGWTHDATGSYALIQIISAGLLVLGAVLFASVRLPAYTPSIPLPE